MRLKVRKAGVYAGVWTEREEIRDSGTLSICFLRAPRASGAKGASQRWDYHPASASRTLLRLSVRKALPRDGITTNLPGFENLAGLVRKPLPDRKAIATHAEARR